MTQRIISHQVRDVSRGGQIAQNLLEKHYSDDQGGFDPDKVQDAITALDDAVRDEFGVTEPIHLWDGYASGDSDDDKLKEETGYDDLDELFDAMGTMLIQKTEKLIEHEE